MQQAAPVHRINRGRTCETEPDVVLASGAASIGVKELSTVADSLLIQRALISVSDKSGVAEIARILDGYGTELVSTGGTAKLLREAGLKVVDTSTLTGFGELLGGRVKTLHPGIHAGILALRDEPAHLEQLAASRLPLFDLVIANLYPVDGSGAPQIDIGGPALVRAAAKNHRFVTVISDPAEYEALAAELASHRGATTPGFRRGMAASAFARTAAYDAEIASMLSADRPPARLAGLGPAARLRYGENPHQEAGFHAFAGPCFERVSGPEAGWNNLLDADAALRLVAEWPSAQPACAVIKHGTPCGAALGSSPSEALARAIDCDPLSAFGGVAAFNCPLNQRAAEILSGMFLELIVAPAIPEQARALLADRQRLRVATSLPPDPAERRQEWRSALGGLLVQDTDRDEATRQSWSVVTRRQPEATEWADLRFAWKVAMHARSNAVVLAGGMKASGIGSGQTSRLDAAISARAKLSRGSPPEATLVAASDGFFPFADGLREIVDAGASAIVQPGGSVLDPEIISAADDFGIAMVMTGQRHFRH